MSNEAVWTDWLENPGNGECPVPEWAEDYQVWVMVEFEDEEHPSNIGEPNSWDWFGNKRYADITHYRYAVPLSLASLARNYSRWGEIVGPVTNTHRMGWVYRDWLRARRDLGYDEPANVTTPEEEEEWRRQDEHQATTAADILRAGLSHMEDRAATYDKPEGERSMAAAVKAFKAVTGDGNMDGEERGWLFMHLLKAVRTQQGGYRADNYEDGAAYFGLQGEAAAKERGNDWHNRRSQRKHRAHPSRSAGTA